MLNEHYASMSTDNKYKTTLIKPINEGIDIDVSEEQVFHLLDTLGATSAGTDGIPHWFLRVAAPSIAAPVAHLFRLSLAQSFVPDQWKSSVITPVPKIAKPKTCSDFRPISVTPILSRILEKLVVRQYIYPVLTEQNINISDQFAFRPTGSTTAALINLLHEASLLLQDYPYVHLISLDFSKAFDTVRHHTLVMKLADLPLPECIHNWFVEWLTNRKHCTKFQDKVSPMIVINASVIQGSGLGPVAFIIDASDLHASHAGNKFCKYADDMYILVPSCNSHTIPFEMEHIQDWADANNLKLNVAKSTEMILRRPGARAQELPPNPLPGIQRVETLKILGVTLSQLLSFEPHIDKIVTQTAQSMYALRVLRAHGLHGDSLCDVTRSTLVAKLIYASPAWWGYISNASKLRLQKIILKLKKLGYLPQHFETISSLCDSADDALFRGILNNENHVLYPLLPPIKYTGHDLRPRSHNRILPKADVAMRKNFIIRMLYKWTL